MLLFMFMTYFKKLLVIASLISTVGGCYVSERPGRPRYARYECGHGYYWNGYHCHRRW